MPAKGFRSITMSSAAYDRFNAAFQSNREALRAMGIKSLSGYVTHMMEERMWADAVFARHTPRFRCLAVEPGSAIMRDTASDGLVEVKIRGGQLRCLPCGRGDCIHAGFLLSVPRVCLELERGG